MRIMLAVAVLASLAACSGAGLAEDYTWKIEAPAQVDKGADFAFKVVTTNPAGEAVEGIGYHYQIQWPGGTVQPLRRRGASGLEERRRAGLTPGNSVLVVTCENREHAIVKVAEATVTVK